MGNSSILCVHGDSTGNGDDEWVYLLTQYLASKNPNAHVLYRLWNADAQRYGTSRVLQQAGGQRHALINADSRSFFLPSSEVSITSPDLDVRVKVALDNYQLNVAQTLAVRYSTSGHRCWRLELNSANRLSFIWSADGATDAGQVVSGTALTLEPGATIWLRATLDVDNGNGGRSVILYSSTDGVTWTSLGSSETTNGTTSVFQSSTQEYEIGARGMNASRGFGKFYEVQIRDGIEGPIANPQPIESWRAREPSGSYIAGEFGGSPTLHVWNGSHSGASATYLSDATRFKMMVPPLVGATIIQSCNHNDGVLFGKEYQAIRDNWLSMTKNRCPMSFIAIINQNPKSTPSNSRTIDAQKRRASELLTWAKLNSIPVANTFLAFVKDTRGLQALVSTDGIHPTAIGSELIRDVVIAS